MNFRQASHLFTVIVSWRDSLIYFARNRFSRWRRFAMKNEYPHETRTDRNSRRHAVEKSEAMNQWQSPYSGGRSLLVPPGTARQFTIALIKTSIMLAMLFVKGKKEGKGRGRPFVFPCQHVTPARIYNRGCSFKTIAINPAPIWYIGISETILAIRINGRNGGAPSRNIKVT